MSIHSSIQPPSDTNARLWYKLVKRIRDEAPHVNARGMETRELLGVSCRFDANEGLFNSTARKLSLKFAFTEAWWMVTGRNDVETVAEVVPRMREYSDDGLTLFGAYGTRFVEQRPRIVQALLNDASTRQAVLTIWDRPHYPVTKDLPCSMTAQWTIRDNQLHCFYNMRSSDVWLGLPYDLFTFSCMTFHVLLELRYKYPALQMGGLFYNAASSHVYERDMESAYSLKYDAIQEPPIVQFMQSFSYCTTPQDFEVALEYLRKQPAKQIVEICTP